MYKHGWCFSLTFDHRCQMSSFMKKISVSFVLQVEETKKTLDANVPLFVSGWKSSQKVCLHDMHDKYLYNNKKHSFIKSSSMPFSQKRFSCPGESQRKTVDLGLNWLHNYTIKSTHAQARTRSHIRKVPQMRISNFSFLFSGLNQNCAKGSKRIRKIVRLTIWEIWVK